jgi:flagellar basal body-associated protein FliL
MEKIVADDNARQGSKGKPVLMVLIGSMVLLAVALTTYMMWAGSTSPDSASQNASRQSTTGSQTGSTNPSDRISPANPAYPAPSNSTATGAPGAPAKK